ncbi:hypothetical protein L6251_02370 [Candidatus Parcubacteria bacterium]|nr:hypothetical protein [Patescibacteria group bacterium]MBU4477354.1 hypothetical protein [Patescibacteria group bacterium]MCG2699244.1 hypothetical protein [Candidatus Parcubacteria bacterium]
MSHKNILELNDSHLKIYGDFLARIFKENCDGKEERECAKIFKEIISDYLESLNLFVKVLYLERIDAKNIHMTAYCKGTKIKDEFLDGYEPELTFCLKPKKPSKIVVYCEIIESGSRLLSHLIKVAFLLDIKNDLPAVSFPKIKHGQPAYNVGNIEKISMLLNRIKETYDLIGHGGLKQLAYLEKFISDFPSSSEIMETFRENMKGLYLRTLFGLLGKRVF